MLEVAFTQNLLIIYHIEQLSNSFFSKVHECSGRDKTCISKNYRETFKFELNARRENDKHAHNIKSNFIFPLIFTYAGKVGEW